MPFSLRFKNIDEVKSKKRRKDIRRSDAIRWGEFAWRVYVYNDISSVQRMKDEWSDEKKRYRAPLLIQFATSDFSAKIKCATPLLQHFGEPQTIYGFMAMIANDKWIKTKISPMYFSFVSCEIREDTELIECRTILRMTNKIAQWQWLVATMIIFIWFVRLLEEFAHLITTVVETQWRWEGERRRVNNKKNIWSFHRNSRMKLSASQQQQLHFPLI